MALLAEPFPVAVMDAHGGLQKNADFGKSENH
jgi:hypothetical protein